MFILREIIGGRTNTYEPTYMPTKRSIAYRKNTLYCLRDGFLEDNSSNAAAETMYIVAETLDYYNPPPTVLCYKVSKDMIFEVCCESPEDIVLGTKVALSTSSGDFIDMVAPDSAAPVATVIEILDRESGKVLIQFD